MARILREWAGLVTILPMAVLALSVPALMPTTDALGAQIKSSGTWTDTCNPPGSGLACMLEGREGAATAQVDNMIILTHGYPGTNSNDTRIYDIDLDMWYDPKPFPAPTAIRAELAGAAHDGLVYAVGGRGSCTFPVAGVCADLEVYDPVANAWSSKLPPMPTARAGLAAVVVGGKLYALGGRTGTSPGSGLPLDCVEAFDIASGSWSPACGTVGELAPMPFPAMDTSAIAHGGKIYVIGGEDPGLLDYVQIYNVAQDMWSLGMPMPTPRANLALGKCGKVILAVGGRDAGSGTTTTVEAYDIPADAWFSDFALAGMPTAKSEHGAVSHGGRVYAIGSGIFGASLNVFEALKCSSLFKN